MDQSDALITTILVWDTEGQPLDGDWITVLWRSFGNRDVANVVSIPKLVEEQADTLRSRYLGWIYELGETRIKGKRLIDHLELRPAFSYWWMTLLAQKANAFLSPRIIDAVKMFALEDLVRKYSPSTIILASSDEILAHTFRLWCGKAGLAFKWRKVQKWTSTVSWIKRFYSALPQPVQAMTYLLRHLKQRWFLRGVGVKKLAGSDGDITFCSYLFNLNKDALQTGRFATSYWSVLHNDIEQEAAGANWLHKYIKHEVLPSTRYARNLINNLNQKSYGGQSHSTMDGVLSWSVITATLRDYCRVVKAGLRLRRANCIFQPTGSNVDFWPLFKQDWCTSLFGTRAMSNCLDINLSEHTFQRLPRQRLGFYLQENQGWERALIYAWKAAGHGQLIGVPHTTVGYWDLRHFFDPCTYQRTGMNDLPLPDKVALNGPAAMAAYRKGEYPENQMVEVEALRYLYLADMPPMKIKNDEQGNVPLHVLVLGDYLPTVTHQQMHWLSEAVPLLPPDTQFRVKPHPACPVQPSDYPSLQLNMASAPLLALLAESDVAFTSNITSAAVDAYCAGVPVISVLEAGALNMSPLRGLKGVVYVTNPTELAQALRDSRDTTRLETESYFCLDKGLPRWRKLLALSQTNVKITT